MYRKIPYVAAEKQVVGERPGMLGVGTLPVYNTPVTPRVNLDAMFDEKHPYWMPSVRETMGIRTNIYYSTLGRGSRADLVDVFGIQWKYEPNVGGSIAVSGHPILEDVNDWKEKIKLPDIDAWDWEAAAKEASIDARFSTYLTFINGFWFERLISFMDFIGAAMAIIDDEQKDAVKELFAAMTDLGCRLVDKFCEYWPMLDLFEIHDDI